MLKTFTLKNGIHIATYDMPTVKSLHVGMTVKGGSLVENDKTSGIAHYMEHMMMQGIPSFPNAQILSNYVESLAGRYNASTSQLIVHSYVTVPFLHLPDAIKIISEIFFQPLFPEEAMEKERQAVLTELKQHQDSRWYKFNQFYRQQRYVAASPLQRETIGKEEILKHIQRKDLVDYWNKYFLPENMYLFVGGNFEDKKLQKLLKTYLEVHENKKKFTGFPKLSNKKDLSERNVAIRQDKELQVNYINLSFPSIEMSAPLPVVLKQAVALDILGRLHSSRLFQLLRYQRGLVYGVTATDARWPGMGYCYIDSEVSSEYLDEVITLIVKTLKEFIDEGPTEKEVEFTKNFMCNQYLMAFDSPYTIGDWVEGGLIWREKVYLPEDYIAMVKDISVKDIVEVMKKYWDFSKLNLILQGPLENTKANVAKYTKMIAPLT